MITSKKKSIVISTENQLFDVLVDIFDSDNWRAEAERNQITVRVMNFLYVELDVGSNASMLIGNNTRLVRSIRQDYFFQLRASRVIFSVYVLIKELSG